MTFRFTCVAVLAVSLAGCARETWPDPPAIDQTEYQKEYETWRQERQGTAAWSLSILGIWPVPEADTAFGSDPSLPIVLPPPAPARAGTFRRSGTTIRVTPARGADVRLEDGSRLEGPTVVESGLMLGSIRLETATMGEGDATRHFVMARDETQPAVRGAAVETYPVNPRWRVTARFEAFDKPRPVRVADVRGGFADFVAPGELVLRLDGQEQRLTAIDTGGEQFFVMFKDPTNRSTTYGGYRILSPAVVKDGEFTVLDFNLAFNPPCAYSRFTTCPLPPRENQLQVAVEAGEKRHATAQGFSTSG